MAEFIGPNHASPMLTAPILALLMTGDVTAPPDFSTRFEYADVTVSDTEVLIMAFDDADQQIGSIALWVDTAGVTWLAADYADGYSLIGVAPERGIVHRDQSLPASVLAERAEELMIYLDPSQPAERKRHTWGECGWKTVAAGAACYLARPLACVGGAIKAGCACVPKLVKEFETHECPWGL